MSPSLWGMLVFQWFKADRKVHWPGMGYWWNWWDCVMYLAVFWAAFLSPYDQLFTMATTLPCGFEVETSISGSTHNWEVPTNTILVKMVESTWKMAVCMGSPYFSPMRLARMLGLAGSIFWPFSLWSYGVFCFFCFLFAKFGVIGPKLFFKALFETRRAQLKHNNRGIDYPIPLTPSEIGLW